MAPGFSKKLPMGKSRKVLKPDYRRAVETMADSEGHGSSGRLDTELTGSDDSCAPRNRSMNLNSDSYKQFGVPMRVLSLSNLSSFERKQLESRLKRELEHVRAFRKNVEDGLLPSSDVRVPNLSQCVKKRVLGWDGNENNCCRSKKAVLPPATGKAMLMKQCDTVLNRLMAHNYGWVFNTPVDVVALKIPDYYTVIKHPMDLGTVKKKLNSGKYVDPWGFAADVRLTFTNAMTYNPRGNDVHLMAETLSKFFEVRWKPIEKKLSVVTDTLVPTRRNVLEAETATLMPPLKKKRTASFGNEIKQGPVKKTISVAEKQKLSSELEESLPELPEIIIDFLKESSSNGNATVDDEIEIDMDALSDETLFKLRQLLDDFLVDKQKNMVKAETCEIEIHNESGPSNSSMQTVKVNDVNEEDVDIGDDPPITSFPPVEIEKDTIVKNSKCSSSSSSSSDSGSSSSSDSDSESDDANISAIVNNIKDTLDSEVNLEQMSAVPRDAAGSVNRVGQVEQKSQSVPISGEVDGRQEVVSAPNERQVSPDKLYRAALLRGRFADIILKAQEKTTGKVEKQDRERLRLEKEELEKRRREEKARLQAEAKAAEEAKRKAELEAAAEAKRKRELEREAARQALQKMEKMVEINDSSRFLEDLEMLSVAPTEPLQNLIEENQDPLGSFNMNRKGNPLERLGLYMKNDDEDEEDDSEEGEID
ncbi:hypothetical protein L1987_53661 [Smallanthus sonchifolius]|uniref:Uncharacterized protein n=1 Tax=Smallanthus sonchifolius TaxID=185202 RepID=A0ACB9EVV4_9ASTR|nr:hypothetical protein L1987_53661 [Smallanthus sonchifolius]